MNFSSPKVPFNNLALIALPRLILCQDRLVVCYPPTPQSPLPEYHRVNRSDSRNTARCKFPGRELFFYLLCLIQYWYVYTLHDPLISRPSKCHATSLSRCRLIIAPVQPTTTPPKLSHTRILFCLRVFILPVINTALSIIHRCFCYHQHHVSPAMPLPRGPLR